MQEWIFSHRLTICFKNFLQKVIFFLAYRTGISVDLPVLENQVWHPQCQTSHALDWRHQRYEWIVVNYHALDWRHQRYEWIVVNYCATIKNSTEQFPILSKIYLNFVTEMQEKISIMCLRSGLEYPSLGHLRMGCNLASLVTAQCTSALGTDIPVRYANTWQILLIWGWT